MPFPKNLYEIQEVIHSLVYWNKLLVQHLSNAEVFMASFRKRNEKWQARVHRKGCAD
jgi:hypothetical protein